MRKSRKLLLLYVACILFFLFTVSNCSTKTARSTLGEKEKTGGEAKGKVESIQLRSEKEKRKKARGNNTKVSNKDSISIVSSGLKIIRIKKRKPPKKVKKIKAVEERSSRVRKIKKKIKKKPVSDIMKAITLFEEFLEKNKESEDKKLIADTYLKIAELHFKDEQKRYEDAMKKYDEVIEKSGFKALIEVIEQPVYDFSKAIETYQSVLDKFPEYHKLDAALYGLAYCYYEQNQKDIANTTFRKLVKQFPKSKYINEVNMRIGEYFFTTNQFEEAEDVFEGMLKVKGNPYKNIVLYKLGWTYFSEGNFPDAIRTFLSVNQMSPGSMGGNISQGLFNESLKYVSRIFSGTSGLLGMINYLKENKREDLLPRLIHFIGDSYKEDEDFKRAIVAYKEFLSRYSSHDAVPVVEHSLIQINEKKLKKEGKILDELDRFIYKYDDKSLWFEKTKDEKIKGRVLAIVKIAQARTGFFRRSVHILFEIINTVTGLEDKNGIQKYLNSGQIDSVKNVAYKNIALIYVNSNGVEGLLNYVAGNESYKIHLPDILKKIAEAYREQNRQWQAVQAYQVLLEKYPGLEDAPIIQNTIVQIYEQGGKADLAMKERKAFIEKFSPGGEWYSAEKINSDRRWGTLALAEKSLRTVALYSHARAQKQKTLEYVEEAISYYEKYLEYFSEHPRIHEMTFLFAELLGEFKGPLESVKYYEKVAWSGIGAKDNQKETEKDKQKNKQKGEGKESKETEDPAIKKLLKYRIDAAYAVVLIYDELKKDENYFGQYTKSFVHTISKYVETFPENKKNPELLYKGGTILFKLEKYKEAQDFFVKLIDKYPQNILTSEAIRLVAQAYFEMKEYKKAEGWYITALTSTGKQAEGEEDKKESIKKMLASTKFKKAEDLQSKNKFLEAGDEFLQISKVTPDSLVASIALFNAGVNFKKIQKCEKIFDVNTRLLLNYPDSKYSQGVMLSYLDCVDKKEQWIRGANNIKAFAKRNPSLSQLAEPVLMSADFYKKGGDIKNARDMYVFFATMFPDNFRIVEAYSKAGEIEFNSKRMGPAKKYFNESFSLFVKMANTNENLDKYFAVKSKFMLGEIAFVEYIKIKIVNPVEKTMLKKQTALEKVLSEYTQTANFKVSEWTTAATFKIGQVFEEFKTAIMASEKPKGLTPIEIEDYDFLLEEQAYPFEDKAVDAYQANIRRLYSDGLYNEWIDKTIERMAYLFPWSYDKKEDAVKEQSMYIVMDN